MHREEGLALAKDGGKSKGKAEIKRRIIGPCTVEESAGQAGAHGRRYSLTFPSVFSMAPDEERWLRHALSTLLLEESGRLVGRVAGERVLFVGLGNPKASVDALGPLAADRIRPTAHLPRGLCEKVGCALLSVFSPLVPALTGMESAVLVRAAASAISPSLILLADAMATRTQARLGCTAELGDFAIAPGAGVGERAPRLDENYLGAPVISVAFPVVLDVAALDTSPDPKSAFDYLIPREGEGGVQRLAAILARAVEEAFGIPSLF